MNRFFAILLAILMLTSCTTSKYLPPKSYENPDLKRKYIKMVQERFPATFTSRQRIVLEVMGKEYDFVGFLAVARDSIRALAMNEFGGKVFDILYTGGKSRLLINAAKLPVNPILDGVVGDLRLCFHPLPKSSFQLGLKDLQPVLTGIDENQAMRLFEFSGKDMHIYEILDGRKIREANLNYENGVPKTIEIVNHKWHYSMHITILDVKTEKLDPRLFEAGP